MKIGDTIITKGDKEYSISEFVTIKDESAINLTSLNGPDNFTMMEAYLNYFIGVGIYTLKRKPIKKLKRRLFSRKLKGKRS